MGGKEMGDGNGGYAFINVCKCEWEEYEEGVNAIWKRE